jgi:hypothetical protein
MRQYKINHSRFRIYVFSFLLGLASSVFTNAQSNKADTLGGIIVFEENGHGLIMMDKDLAHFNLSNMMNWKEALDHCRKANKNGYDDWRIPTKEEMLMILHKARQNPEIKLKKGAFYWTVEEYDKKFAWAMLTENGQFSRIKKRYACYVRPVRNF